MEVTGGAQAKSSSEYCRLLGKAGCPIISALLALSQKEIEATPNTRNTCSTNNTTTLVFRFQRPQKISVFPESEEDCQMDTNSDPRKKNDA